MPKPRVLEMPRGYEVIDNDPYKGMSTLYAPRSVPELVVHGELDEDGDTDDYEWIEGLLPMPVAAFPTKRVSIVSVRTWADRDKRAQAAKARARSGQTYREHQAKLAQMLGASPESRRAA